MAITTCGNCIEFGTCTMCGTPTGFSFNGVFCAAQGFCDTRVFQGSVAGYMLGGQTPISPFPAAEEGGTDIIQKVSFVSDGNATDIGELSTGTRNSAGVMSGSHGYNATGGTGSLPLGTVTDVIQKFPFASDAPATDVAEAGCSLTNVSGHSYLTGDKGFITGCNSPGTSRIDQFSTATDSPSTFGAYLYPGYRCSHAGTSSATEGYVIAGAGPNITASTYVKFPFASVASAAAVGEIIDASSCYYQMTAMASADNGYHAGGKCFPDVGGINNIDVIGKFPFASGGNTSDIAELAGRKHNASPGSGTTHGYTIGGYNSPGITGPNRMQVSKFPFASDSPSACIGDVVPYATYNYSHGNEGGVQT